MADETIKVILDTDIGNDIDDAVALAYLLCQPRCELVGVTTVATGARRRAEMVSAMCRHVGRDDIPIHAGCGRGMLVPLRQGPPPQAEALGDRPRRRDFPPATAVEFLRRTIREHPGEITLLTIGPLTNAGVLFAADPEVPGLLKQMVLMCGQFFGAMGGEWNAINDPHATAVAYGAADHARPPRHVSFGLDVTRRCTLPAEECRRRFTAKALEPVRDFAEVWFRRCDRITFHDPLAAACLFEPGLCEYAAGEVAVSVVPPTAGWTVFRPGEAGRHTVARSVDAGAFFEHYFDVVA